MCVLVVVDVSVAVAEDVAVTGISLQTNCGHVVVHDLALMPRRYNAQDAGSPMTNE